MGWVEKTGRPLGPGTLVPNATPTTHPQSRCFHPVSPLSPLALPLVQSATPSRVCSPTGCGARLCLSWPWLCSPLSSYPYPASWEASPTPPTQACPPVPAHGNHSVVGSVRSERVMPAGDISLYTWLGGVGSGLPPVTSGGAASAVALPGVLTGKGHSLCPAQWPPC